MSTTTGVANKTQDVTGIKATDIAFVRFAAPDLDVMEGYFSDFGMHRSERADDVLYMRGTDDEGFIHVSHTRPEPGFIGLAFAAESIEDLERLAQHADFADITELDGPGGGLVTRATDPDGLQVEVVAGRGSVGSLDPAIGRPPLNDAEAQPRLGAPVRLASGPSHVKRLGHIVLNVSDFRATEAWYKGHLGLVTSDEIAIDENLSIGAFMRCDRGTIHVDHHTLAIIQGPQPVGFNHAAFEVANFDDLMTGHTHLQGKERQHQWGVGRHVLGSQIYDYWMDPYGHMVEHWTDGDLFNNETPPNMSNLGELMESQWGPMMGNPPG